MGIAMARAAAKVAEPRLDVVEHVSEPDVSLG
jgi:hypothetical protein